MADQELLSGLQRALENAGQELAQKMKQRMLREQKWLGNLAQACKGNLSVAGKEG